MLLNRAHTLQILKGYKIHLSVNERQENWYFYCQKLVYCQNVRMLDLVM